MELASKYAPQEVEARWYQYWTDNKLFASKPDNREPYTIVIPPTKRDRCAAHGSHAQQYHSGHPYP